MLNGAPRRKDRESPAAWYRDVDGVWTAVKRYNDNIIYTFSENGVSTVVWTSNGPTVTNSLVGTNEHYVTITGAGEVTATITNADGETIERVYRFRAWDHGPSDYA